MQSWIKLDPLQERKIQRRTSATSRLCRYASEMFLIFLFFAFFLNSFWYELFLQTYNSTRKVGVSNLTYHCPLANTTGCKMRLQVPNRQATVELWSSGQHALASHATDRSAHLTHAQRVGVQRAVRACPLQPAASILDESVDFSPGKEIAYSRSSQRLVEQAAFVILISLSSVLLWIRWVHTLILYQFQLSIQRAARHIYIYIYILFLKHAWHLIFIYLPTWNWLIKSYFLGIYGIPSV